MESPSSLSLPILLLKATATSGLMSGLALIFNHCGVANCLGCSAGVLWDFEKGHSLVGQLGDLIQSMV